MNQSNEALVKALLGDLKEALKAAPLHVNDSEEDIFYTINARLYRSGLSFAWKSYPSKPPYNPELGVFRIPLVSEFELEVSVGLENDGFERPCCVIAIVNTTEGK